MAQHTTPLEIDGIIREKEVLRTINTSSTELWRKVNAGAFPAPIRLGERSLGWKISEVQSWIDSRPRYTGPSDHAKLIMAKRHPKPEAAGAQSRQAEVAKCP